MDVEFRDGKIDRLETDESYTAGFSREIVKMFRRRMQQIRAATDERAFYALKSLHYEKLKGDRSHQKSMRINDQWRLILEIGSRDDGQYAVIVSIEDYH